VKLCKHLIYVIIIIFDVGFFDFCRWVGRGNYTNFVAKNLVVVHLEDLEADGTIILRPNKARKFPKMGE
jgi:hypothetical protein